MRYENRKYMIIPFTDVTDEMVENAIETSMDTLRHSQKGTDRVLLKFNGDTPEVFDGITTYTYPEILAILNDTDGDWWSDVD